MTSERKVIKAERGVSLLEVVLRGNGGIVDVAYVVKSKRTLEASNFGNRAEAETAFDEELARISLTAGAA